MLSSKSRYVWPRDYYGIISHFYLVVIDKASFGILADGPSNSTCSGGGGGMNHKGYVGRRGPCGHFSIEPRRVTALGGGDAVTSVSDVFKKFYSRFEWCTAG